MKYNNGEIFKFTTFLQVSVMDRQTLSLFSKTQASVGISCERSQAVQILSQQNRHCCSVESAVSGGDGSTTKIYKNLNT